MKIALRFTLLVLIVIIVACSKKSIPVSTVTTKKADSTNVLYSMVSADVLNGKAIFSQNCNKCHRLYQPDEFTKKEWDNILPGMFNKAQVDTSQQRLIRAYVYAGK